MNRYFFPILLLLTLVGPYQAAAETGSRVPSAALTLEIELGKKQAYPGEVVPLTVTFRANGVTVRNIGYPNLVLTGSDRIPFASPAQVSDDDGRIVTYRFSGKLVAGGENATIGPATLECEVMEPAAGSAAFFGEATPAKVTVTSPVAQLQLLPLPNEGRPASFSGAVGRFCMTVVGKPDTVSVGDPITVITTITGAGSLDNARCPDLSAPGLQSFPARSTRTGKGLNCEQIVIPRNQAPVPPVRWSYFDPTGKRYVTLTRTVPIIVKPASNPQVAEHPKPVMPEPAGSMSGRKPFSIPMSAAIVTTASLILVVGGCVVLRRKIPPLLPIRADVSVPQMLHEAEQALHAGDVGKFYTTVFTILQRVATMDTDISPHSVAGVSHIRHPIPIPEMTLLFQRCDQVRYGRLRPDSAQMNFDFSLLQTMLSKLT